MDAQSTTATHIVAQTVTQTTLQTTATTHPQAFTPDSGLVETVMTFVREFGFIVYVLLVLVVTVLVINWLFKQTVERVLKRIAPHIKPIHIGKLPVLNKRLEMSLISTGARLLRLAMIGVVAYFVLIASVAWFSWSPEFTRKFLDYLLKPVQSVLDGILAYIPNLFTIVVILFLTRYVLRFLRLFAQELERGVLKLPNFYPDWAMPTYRVVRFVVWIFTFAAVFPYLPGSNTPVFQGLSVVLGVLISFGSSSAITNIIAGLLTTYARPFKRGDRIKVGDVTGDVIEKTLLVTRLLTIKNEEITIPNATIISSNIVNYSALACEGKDGLIIHATITIGYNVLWQDVHGQLIAAALRTRDILPTPQPFVLQTSLNDWHISYQINAYTKTIQRLPDIQSELLQHIQNTFNEAGIEIMSPQNLTVRDGNQSTIPAQYRVH